MRIELPWPPATLSQNGSHGHWTKVAKARKDYKDKCLWSGVGNKPIILTDTVHLKITFCPPNKLRRDLDGCLSRTKVGLDAVAELWGVDDSCFQPLTLCFGEPVKNGKVIIEVLK